KSPLRFRRVIGEDLHWMQCRSASRAPIGHCRLAHPQLLGNLTRRRPLPPALLGVRQQFLSQMLVEWSLRGPAMRNNQRPQLRRVCPCHAPTLADPPPTVTTGMGEVLQLYSVERDAKTGPPEELLRVRRERSKPILRQIQDWALSTHALPQSGLGKAIAYMGSVWNGLQVFLDDPHVELDNNRTERALRGVVIGRKNHYGSRSRRGTEVAALFYSLIESAKLAGIGPHTYLRAAVNAALRGGQIPLPHEMA